MWFTRRWTGRTNWLRGWITRQCFVDYLILNFFQLRKISFQTNSEDYIITYITGRRSYVRASPGFCFFFIFFKIIFCCFDVTVSWHFFPFSNMLNNTQCIVLFVHVSCHYLNGLYIYSFRKSRDGPSPWPWNCRFNLNRHVFFIFFKNCLFFILSSQRFFPSEKLMYYERDQIKYLISFRKMGKKNSNNNNNNNQRMSRRENVPTHTLNNSPRAPAS